MDVDVLIEIKPWIPWTISKSIFHSACVMMWYSGGFLWVSFTNQSHVYYMHSIILHWEIYKNVISLISNIIFFWNSYFTIVFKICFSLKKHFSPKIKRSYKFQVPIHICVKKSIKGTKIIVTKQYYYIGKLQFRNIFGFFVGVIT